MTSDISLTTDEWDRVLTELELTTYAEVVDALANARDLPRDRAEDLVDEALETGPLVELEDAGTYGTLRLAETDETAENPALEGDSPNENPGCSTDKPASSTPDHDVVALAAAPAIEPGVYPEDLVDAERWLTWKETDDGRKVPRAPYANPDWPDKFVSAQDPEVWVSFDTARKWADSLSGYGLAFNIRDREEYSAEEYVLIDYDDVRDPDTGRIHPTVREHVERARSYADVSTSGTGVHIFVRGALPEDVKAIEAPLPETEHFPDAEIEVYDSARYSAMTGEHLEGTPRRTTDCQDFLEALAEEFATVAEGTPDELLREPETSKEDLADVDTTTDIQDVLDAIQHTGPGDIRLRSPVTHERGDGSKSLDPSWADSKSGTRLAEVGDGWVYRQGMIGLDALQVVALEERIITDEQAYPRGEDFWSAVDALRDRGAHIPEYEPTEADTDPVAAIPFARLDALSDPERERFARKRGLEWPDTDEARDRLRDALFRELRAGNTTVLDAPTALGKSYTVATEPWRNRADVTGEAPVVQLHKTRDARDEAATETRGSSAAGAVLKGRQERCSVARGDHDPSIDEDEDPPEVVVTIDGRPASEWFDRMCDEKGLAFSMVHALGIERNDQGLDEFPCCEDGTECPAKAQWDGLPRDDEGHPAVDVIHATHQFAYVPSLRQYTNLVLDEQPDYTVDLPQDRVRRMVNAYLREIDAPATTWEAFVQLARHTANDTDAASERDALDDALGREPGREWYVEEPDAHALAPDLTKAIWNALRWEDPDANGRRSTKVFHEPPRFDTGEDENYGGNWLSVTIDEENTVQTVRVTPDFSPARAVIGLDAHPSMQMWQLNAGPSMTRDAVLDPEERALWRRYERGLTVVQIGEATRPRTGENAREWTNEDRVRKILDALREHYGDGFDTGVTTAQVEPVLRSLLEDVTGAALDGENTLHYGQEKSRNPEPFVEADAGYVYACMDPGDDMVLDTLAELGLDATPATVETEDGDTKREKGRTFEGADADAAREVLASVRENHVAQAAGRYARDPDDPDSRAIVFVDTDAAPPGFADLQVPGVEWLATALQKDIITELRGRESATIRNLAEAAECSKEHVRTTLKRLHEAGSVSRHKDAGEHGADVYHVEDLDTAIVTLGVDKTTNDALKDTNRWSLAVWSLQEARTSGFGSDTSNARDGERSNAGDPASIDGD